MWIFVLLLPFFILGLIAIVLLICLEKKKRACGIFHIEKGILYTHEIIAQRIIIGEIESVKIDHYLKNGEKYLVRFKQKNGKSAGLLITYDSENELERLKKELKENGYEI